MTVREYPVDSIRRLREVLVSNWLSALHGISSAERCQEIPLMEQHSVSNFPGTFVKIPRRAEAWIPPFRLYGLTSVGSPDAAGYRFGAHNGFSPEVNHYSNFLGR